VRLAQESIATLTGMPGFEAVPSHDQVCESLLRYCSAPQQEVLEYLRRDVANLALGNKDNHARNTALQRDFSGRIALTPLFDFAPMYLHPDGIARRIRWDGNDGGQPDWSRVLDAVCESAARVRRERRKKGPELLQRAALVEGLRAMVPALQRIAAEGEAMGMEADVLKHLRPSLMARAHELMALA
jgi:serine/threonine-protein kinase HipA